MDYTGLSYSNYDYQDNLYLVSNVKPVNPPSAVAGASASGSQSGIGLTWAANSEGNVVGYRIYRSSTLRLSCKTPTTRSFPRTSRAS